MLISSTADARDLGMREAAVENVADYVVVVVAARVGLSVFVCV